MATGAPGAVTDGLCCMGHCTTARGSCTAPEPVTFLLGDPFALVLACKDGRKTRGSLARSARLISGSARLGSLKNVTEPSQCFSSGFYRASSSWLASSSRAESSQWLISSRPSNQAQPNPQDNNPSQARSSPLPRPSAA